MSLFEEEEEALNDSLSSCSSLPDALLTEREPEVEPKIRLKQQSFPLDELLHFSSSSSSESVLLDSVATLEEIHKEPVAIFRHFFVEKLVVLDSLKTAESPLVLLPPNTKIFVSWNDTHRFLGIVLTVLGPVDQCLYLVQLTDEFTEKEGENSSLRSLLQLNQHVFVTSACHTQLSVPSRIESIRPFMNVSVGTDASFVNDTELPSDIEPDFSDDDKELQWNKRKREENLTIPSETAETVTTVMALRYKGDSSATNGSFGKQPIQRQIDKWLQWNEPPLDSF